MTVYVLVSAKTGEFCSVWSTVELAREARESLIQFFKTIDTHVAYHVLAWELDKINEFEVI